MLTIEVKDAPVGMMFDAATPAGVWRQSGGFWIAPGNACCPTFCSSSPALDALLQNTGELVASSTSGVSESTLLRAIAIAQRPELAKELL